MSSEHQLSNINLDPVSNFADKDPVVFFITLQLKFYFA